MKRTVRATPACHIAPQSPDPPGKAFGRCRSAYCLRTSGSLYNVGAFFRTADAVSLEKLYLTGITGYPPQHMIAKTALGADETVPWQHSADAEETLAKLRSADYEIAAVETSAHAIDLFDWQPRFPVCVLFGHETDGLTAVAAGLADTHIRIPMLGRKHSLNVASAGAVVLYELLRKYRALQPK